MRIIYMPTHRPCAEAINNAVLECSVLREHTSHDYMFLLIEHNESAYEEHAEILGRITRKFAVECIHLTPGRWEMITSELLHAAALPASAKKRMKALLSPRDVAYGSGPNKAFIVAAALGIKTVHRRDSDQVPDHRDEGKVFPGILEAAAIGQPIKNVTPLASKSSLSPFMLGQPVLFVGSNVFGDSGHDRRDLLSLGEEYIVRLEQLSRPAMPVDELRALVHDKFVNEPAIRYHSDFYEICDSKRTAIGVSCVRGLFLELPEMPISETLGSDYFQKSLLHHLGRPVLFHSRKMRHSYDPERAANLAIDKAVTYALRDLRNLILLRVRSALNRDVAERRKAYLTSDGLLDTDEYADGLLKVSQAELPGAAEIPRKYSEVYASAACDASGALAEKLHAVAAASGSMHSDFVGDVSRGVADYSWLIRHWKKLARAAPSTSQTLQSYIESLKASPGVAAGGGTAPRAPG